MHDKILILDFGSQFTQLIARRIREAHVFCEVYPCHLINEEWLKAYAADGHLKGIILSGSHSSTYDPDAGQVPATIFSMDIPILGICYGMQIMAQHFGGQVQGSEQREFGYATIRAHGHTLLLKNIQDSTNSEGHGLLDVWMSHGDKVTTLPQNFKLMASTNNCPIAGMANESKNFYGLQFHPEVTHTKQGKAILERFVLDICHANADWNMASYIDEAVARIKEQVGDEEVILALSGGVDSSVAAALIHRAIGHQLTCVFVDHGLLRLNEGAMVMEKLAGQFHANIIHVKAEEQFLAKLKGVSEPEQKRKIIGYEFINVFKTEAEKLKQATPGSKGATFLAQGTIYPDVIESGITAQGGKSATIKSHHNVGGLPEELGLKLLEPLRELFKDEVRELGIALGLPPEMVYRHPFPGPGLGVRILGEIKKEYADLLRLADAIFIEELRNFKDPATGKNWYDLTSQAFAVFLPVKSVGVMGDNRTYDYVVALRAIQTTDFMTADWAELPYPLLKKASTRIINEVRGINRVTYDISSKPPATIEWE